MASALDPQPILAGLRGIFPVFSCQTKKEGGGELGELVARQVSTEPVQSAGIRAYGRRSPTIRGHEEQELLDRIARPVRRT